MRTNRHPRTAEYIVKGCPCERHGYLLWVWWSGNRHTCANSGKLFNSSRWAFMLYASRKRCCQTTDTNIRCYLRRERVSLTSCRTGWRPSFRRPILWGIRRNRSEIKHPAAGLDYQSLLHIVIVHFRVVDPYHRDSIRRRLSILNKIKTWDPDEYAG